MKSLNISKEHLVHYALTCTPVVTFNADPYCAESPDEIDEVVRQILENDLVQIDADDEEEITTALLRLDYTYEDKEEIAVVRAGDMTMAIDIAQYISHNVRTSHLNENTLLAFKVTGGCGNRRHVSFVGYDKKIGDFINQHDLLPPVGEPDENGDPTDDLTTPDKEWRDSVGNPVTLTNAMIESGIGRIDIDGDYNTIYTMRLGDIDYHCPQEFKAIDDYNIKTWLAVNSDIDITDLL